VTLLPPDVAGAGSEEMKRLLDEARDYMESPQLLEVFRVVTASAADRIAEQLLEVDAKDVFSDGSSLPLAKLFGSFIALSKSLLDPEAEQCRSSIRRFADQSVLNQFCEGLFFQEGTLAAKA
ncbi:unnamed protein product, partial [Polarella glacialis]